MISNAILFDFSFLDSHVAYLSKYLAFSGK